MWQPERSARVREVPSPIADVRPCQTTKQRTTPRGPHVQVKTKARLHRRLHPPSTSPASLPYQSLVALRAVRVQPLAVTLVSVRLKLLLPSLTLPWTLGGKQGGQAGASEQRAAIKMVLTGSWKVRRVVAVARS